MIFNESMIGSLRLTVKNKLSEKRYIHTIGVQEMAKHIGNIILPERVDELCVAALLHDITKELTHEQQLKLLDGTDIALSNEDLDTAPALHSISAIPFIRATYPEYVTPDILSSVLNHTLGKDNMSVFDEIIFISDYIEIGRTYPSCIEVRDYLLSNINLEKSYDNNLNFLHKATLMAIEYTISSLKKRGEKIHSKTYLTKAYFESVIKS